MTTVGSASGTSGTTPSSSSSSGSTSSITTSGSSTTSTIDWDALIQAAVEAKQVPATQIATTITANQAKIAAYTTLQSDLKTLAADIESLTSSIVNSNATNVFASRAATITASDGVSTDSSLSMSVANGAATGDHTLSISQIATAQKVIGASQPSESAALGYSGTFSIGLAGGTAASITVTAGMTMQDVVSDINAQSSTTNVEASIVQVSSGSYEMVLSGTQDAADITYASTSGDDVLNKLGVTDSSGAFTDVLQTAQSAAFTLDGISLTRNSNDFDDVLDGVTFDLIQPTPSGTTLNINIGTDETQIDSAISTFQTDYNKFRTDVLAQQATSTDGTASSTAVLFGDGTMRDIMDQLQGVMAGSVGGLTMADLGLSFDTQNTNTLVYDQSDLDNSLSTNLAGITQLLTAQTTTSSSQLSVVNNGLNPQSFTLDVQVDSSGKLVSASVGGDSSMFTVQGDSIIGQSGTPYSGMAFTYTGSTSQSITVTSTLGLASQIYQIANNASIASGSLQTQITNLTNTDNSDQQKITDIDSSVATYQAQLQTQYATYQAEIQSSNNTLNYLQALLNSENTNS